ncbi:MAG: pyrroloquinoline quinone biosynthesis protein PqqB [Burkholderiaceae bacterium]|nr:pyrroloquinoline quinone biosynthesis protein PqqB [Burkholderiaceae bacterium]
MKLRVLGSAAGGGFPQWNCNCRNCAGLRSGRLRARPRTQSSVAVRDDGSGGWALVNASPDVLAQLRAHADLQPARALRDSALVAIVLVDGQIDHATGLLLLREATRPWPLWCTDAVHADLSESLPILPALSHYCGVARRRIEPDGTPFVVDGLPQTRWRAFAVAGKPAPYSPFRDRPRRGDNIALEIAAAGSGRRVFYAPGLAAIDEEIWARMREADCVLVDGTFWSDDEMIRLGAGAKTARDIGHLPQSGPGGMLEWLARLPPRTRRVLIHINNTNPILDEDSEERHALERLGVEVAFDGMEIDL